MERERENKKDAPRWPELVFLNLSAAHLFIKPDYVHLQHTMFLEEIELACRGVDTMHL